MVEFRLNLIVEVDRIANALAVQTPVPLQVLFDRGRWKALCAEPPVSTDEFDNMEGAVVARARQVAAEAQASVYDRPVVLARIGPEDVPPGRF